MLNENVVKLLKGSMWDLATCANGEPNVVPVAFKDVTADGKLKGCLHSREEIDLRGLHGWQLQNAIRQGIAHKPQRHHLSERKLLQLHSQASQQVSLC